MKSPGIRTWVEACVGAALVLGALYAVIVPFGEKPDEPSHMARIVYEARYGRTPSIASAPVFPNVVTYEAVQPPAYYWLAARLLRRLPPVTWSMTPSDHFGCVERSRHFALSAVNDPPRQALTLRLTGLICVAATGIVVCSAAGMLGVPPYQAVLASAFAALTPQVLFVSTGVTNDGMALTAGSLILWMAIRAGLAGSWIHALGAGALSMMALGVKLNIAPYLVGAPLLILGCGFRRSVLNLVVFALGLLAVAVPGVCILQTHGIDPRTAVQRLSAPVAFVERPDYLAFIRGMFATYWARFGWMDIEAPFGVRALWVAFLVLASGGWVMRGHGQTRRWVALWILLGSALVGWMFTLRSSNQIQGRFLFPFAGVIALLLAKGIGLLSGRALPALALAGILLANVASLARLGARHRPAEWPADMSMDTHQCRDDRTVEPSLSGGAEIGQTFIGTQAGLCAVDVVLTGRAGTAGTVHMTIADATTGEVFREAALPCARIEPARLTRFRFAPVMESGNRLLRMSLRTEGASPRGSLSLRSASGDPYLEGACLVAGVPREGDLRFVAWAQNAREDEG